MPSIRLFRAALLALPLLAYCPSQAAAASSSARTRLTQFRPLADECPTESQYKASGSEVDNQLQFTFDVLDQAAADSINGGILRLFQANAPQGEGSDLGLIGLTAADSAPEGVITRYTASYGPLTPGVEYDGHAVLSLKDSTTCSTNGVSVIAADAGAATEASSTGSAPTPISSDSSTAVSTPADASTAAATSAPTTTTSDSSTASPDAGSVISSSSTGIGQPQQPAVSSSTGSASSDEPGNIPFPVVPVPPSSVAPGQCPYLDWTYTARRMNSGAVVITFQNKEPSKKMNWVDLHVSINQKLVVGSSKDAPMYNVRMGRSSDTVFSLIFPVIPDIPVGDIDYVNYFFTYSADNTACNTDVMNYQVSTTSTPSQGASQAGAATCPVISFTQTAAVPAANQLKLTFTNTAPEHTVNWVDAHVTITSDSVNGQYNYRMTNPTTNSFELNMPGSDNVVVPADASISYFFTYFTEGIGCNTDNYAYGSTSVAGGVCPALQYTPIVNRKADDSLNVTFQVTDGNAADWVDLHVTITDALASTSSAGKPTLSPMYNYRMKKVDTAGKLFAYQFPGADGVRVPDTKYLEYWFTYQSTSKTACNTAKSQYGAQQAVNKAIDVVYTDNQKNAAGAKYSAASGIAVSVMASVVVMMRNLF